jgi:hypothetical protein
MQHPVVRAPKPERFQFMIGVADEIPVGEEQQFDDVPAQIARLLTRLGGRGSRVTLRIRGGRTLRKIYVSHIDVSWVECYKTASRCEILDRFVGDNVPNASKSRQASEGRQPEA